MSTRNRRTRSSRYSSPAIVSDSEVKPTPDVDASSRNGQQMNLDQWIEPPVRNLPPSFEDTKGLERGGVLSAMAPLGTRPPPKALPRQRINVGRQSQRATPLQNEETMTPVGDEEKVELASPIDVETMSDVAPVEGRTVISSPPRGRPAKKDIAEMFQQSFVLPHSPDTGHGSHISPKPQSIQQHLRQDRFQSYVDIAIQEAHQKETLNLIPGFENIREDANADFQLWDVVDAVVHHTPTTSQWKTFKRYVKSGIKQYARNGSIQTSPSRYDQNPNHDHPSETRFHSPSINNSNSVQQRSTSFNSQTPPVTNSPLKIRFPANWNVNKSPQPVPHPRSNSNHDRSSNGEGRVMDIKSSMTSPVRKRSRSISSSSSLSSAKSMPEDFTPPIEISDQGLGDDGQSVRPMPNRQGSTRSAAANRLRSAGTNHAGVKHPLSDLNDTAKYAAKKLKTGREDLNYDPEEVSQRREQFYRESFHDYDSILRPESDERELVNGHSQNLPSSTSNVPRPNIHPNHLTSLHAALSLPPTVQATPEIHLQNGAGRKRPYDEIEKDEINASPRSSSPAAYLFAPPPPAAATSSRAVTPRAAKLAPQNKTRRSARVMVSPNKPKNGGITAGISRAGPGRDSVIGNGADSGAEDNDEYCAACGGEGKLLCCDGCPNSFHHACLEPPLDPDQEVDGEWYCPRCLARHNKQTIEPTGLLGQVIRRVDDTIPKAFALPLDIRDYFEGVKTGDEGEYEETSLPRTHNNVVKMNRAGFIDEPNYKELRDNKGNMIFCYRCRLTSNGRDIVPCDFCPAKWHLDCIDPPLAVPPRRRIGDKPNATWRCPLHAEHDLAGIGCQVEAAPGDLGSLPRLRKPKNAIALDVSMSRGFKNNGVIEVGLMKDETPNIKDVYMHGTIYRMPEEGIRLDFIDRVKKSWYEDQTFPRLVGGATVARNRTYRPDGVVLHHPPTFQTIKYDEVDFYTSAQAIAIAETAKANAEIRHKSVREQHAILSLAEFSQKGDSSFKGDAVTDLINQLVIEAPLEVTEAISNNEKTDLIRLKALINKRLAVLGESTPDQDQNHYHDRVDKLPKVKSEPVIKESQMINGDREYDGDNSDMEASS